MAIDYTEIARLSDVAEQLMAEAVKVDLQIDGLIGDYNELTAEQCEALLNVLGAGIVRGDVRARYKALTGRIWVKPNRIVTDVMPQT